MLGRIFSLKGNPAGKPAGTGTTTAPTTTAAATPATEEAGPRTNPQSSDNAIKALDGAKKRSSALSTTDILGKQETEIKKLVETFCIPKDLAWDLCERYAWKMERITEYLLERATEMDEMEEEVPAAPAAPSKAAGKAKAMDCPICSDTIPLDGTIKLSLCPDEHRGCLSCWSHHATIQVKEGALPIACMFGPCSNRLVDPDVISTLLDRETLDLYKYKNATNFMAKSRRMRWCPSAACQKAVEFGDSLVDVDVRCECGTPFCFTCGNEWHSPIDCATYRKWCDKCTSEGESAKWISAFTRPCPNPECLKPIEKNGGCPHMMCRACQKHFCWTCMELYINGGHNCKGQANTATQAEAVKSFDRYRFGYMGFDTCITKEKSLRDLTKLANSKTTDYRERYSESWNKATPFEDAVVVYADVLRVLRFTFVLCYFAEEVGVKEAPFLTFLQEDLLQAVQKLEKLVSSNETTQDHKEEIKRAATAAKLKAQSIISTSREGITQNADLYRLGS